MKHSTNESDPPERILLSKTDALGDLLIATGLVKAVLSDNLNAKVIWIVREGYEHLSTLLDGSIIFRPNPSSPPAREAARVLREQTTDQRPWSRVVFIPIGIDPYRRDSKGGKVAISWWGRFIKHLDVQSAIVGSTTRNWLDQLIVMMSKASEKIGFGHSPGAQEIQPIHLQGISGIPRSLVLTVEIPFLPEQSERQRLRTLSLPLCRANTRFKPVIALPGSRHWAEPKVEEGILGFAPGVGDPRRQVNPDSVCNAIAGFLKEQSEFSMKCALIEGPVDRAITTRYARMLAACGVETTRFRFRAEELPQLVSLLEKLPLFLTHETFHAQLASMIGTPTVAMWGLGHWGRFFPETGRLTIVHTDMACRNCGWNCCFDQWKCVSELPPNAIKRGLEKQWNQRQSRAVSFVKTPSPLPRSEILEALRHTAFRSSERQQENKVLNEWIRDLRGEVANLTKWTKSEQRLRESAEQSSEEIAHELLRVRNWAKEERDLRISMLKSLREAEAQRDDAQQAVQEEARIRQITEKSLEKSESGRGKALEWAETEKRIRKEAESLLKDAEQQRDDARIAFQEESKLRTAVQALLCETETMLREAKSWAIETTAQRDSLRTLLDETEAQRDDARTWAQEERRLRIEATALLKEAEAQRDDARAWAQEERQLRIEATTLLKEAETQRDDARAWVQEEKCGWAAARSALQSENSRVEELLLESATLKASLAEMSSRFEDARGRILEMTDALRSMEKDRNRYQRRFLCRLVVKTTEWKKPKSSISRP